MNKHKLTSALLLASAVNLTLMIPGGFVETREFPQYSLAVLTGFNLFLTVLGLGSFVLAWRVWRHGVRSAWPMLAGLSFTTVYAIDLAEWFPVSVTPMSPLLTTLEAIGTALGIALALSAETAWDKAAVTDTPTMPTGILAALSVATLGIVAFATMAAVGH